MTGSITASISSFTILVIPLIVFLNVWLLVGSVGFFFKKKHAYYKSGDSQETLGKANNPFTNPSFATALKF